MTSGSRARLTLLTFQEINLPSSFTADFISELINAFETNNGEKIYHSIKVTIFAHMLGKEIHLSQPELKELFFASLLHDIGGLSTSVHVSNQLIEIPDIFGQKTDFYIFAHPIRSRAILNRFPTFRKISDIVHKHHEFYDGSGFPLGLSANEIPLLSRIIRIADSVDIITRLHDIQSADELDSFLNIIAGEEFDPELYDIFTAMLTKDDFIQKMRDESFIQKQFNRIRQTMKDQYYLASTDTVNRFFETIALITDNVTSPEKMHSMRVAEFAEQIAFTMGFEEDELLNIRWAAFLHDIGKLAGNRSVYNKLERLSDEEWISIRRHPEKSYEILNNVGGMQKVAYYILYHHENFDGSGYPEQLSGEKIPMISRILRVADAFEAMTSERIYHRRRDWQMALKELKKQAGKQFDPDVVEATIDHYDVT